MGKRNRTCRYLDRLARPGGDNLAQDSTEGASDNPRCLTGTADMLLVHGWYAYRYGLLAFEQPCITLQHCEAQGPARWNGGTAVRGVRPGKPRPPGDTWRCPLQQGLPYWRLLGWTATPQMAALHASRTDRVQQRFF